MYEDWVEELSYEDGLTEIDSFYGESSPSTGNGPSPGNCVQMCENGVTAHVDHQISSVIDHSNDYISTNGTIRRTHRADSSRLESTPIDNHRHITSSRSLPELGQQNNADPPIQQLSDKQSPLPSECCGLLSDTTATLSHALEASLSLKAQGNNGETSFDAVLNTSDKPQRFLDKRLDVENASALTQVMADRMLDSLPKKHLFSVAQPLHQSNSFEVGTVTLKALEGPGIDTRKATKRTTGMRSPPELFDDKVMAECPNVETRAKKQKLTSVAESTAASVDGDPDSKQCNVAEKSKSSLSNSSPPHQTSMQATFDTTFHFCEEKPKKADIPDIEGSFLVSKSCSRADDVSMVDDKENPQKSQRSDSVIEDLAQGLTTHPMSNKKAQKSAIIKRKGRVGAKRKAPTRTASAPGNKAFSNVADGSNPSAATSTRKPRGGFQDLRSIIGYANLGDLMGKKSPRRTRGQRKAEEEIAPSAAAAARKRHEAQGKR